MQTPGFGASPNDVDGRRSFLVACALLSAGSSLLLLAIAVAALLRYPIGWLLIAAAFAPFALGLHAMAWFFLADGARRSRTLRLLFAVSLGGYAVMAIAVVARAWTLPPWWGDYTAIGRLIISPYLPSVFGPVVLAHAALLAFAARGRGTAGRSIVWLGSASLVCLALFGLFDQARWLATGLPSDWLFAWSGLTAFAYAFVALGWLAPNRTDAILQNAWPDA